jgi:hypothetical protein
MKMRPIEFARVYDSLSAERFEPLKDEAGRWIHDRAIVCRPRHWTHGAYVDFAIIDNYVASQKRCVPAGQFIVREQRSFHDKDFPKEAELMRNLASGDLRAGLAEETASVLFWRLFAFSPELRKWLPKVAAFYRAAKKQQRAQTREGPKPKPS